MFLSDFLLMTTFIWKPTNKTAQNLQNLQYVVSALPVTHPPMHLCFTKEDVKYISPAVVVIYVPCLWWQHINQMASFRSANPEKEHKNPNSQRYQKENSQFCWKATVKKNSKLCNLLSAIHTFNQCSRLVTSDKDD